MNREDVLAAGITHTQMIIAVLDVDAFVQAAKTMVSRNAELQNGESGIVIATLANAMATQFLSRVTNAQKP